jgi:uncharacterized protein YoxC
MNSASEILVIILSVFLAFFLVLGIVLAIYLIRLTRQIRDVTKSAEHTIGSIGSFVDGVARFTSPMFFAEMIKRCFKKTKKDKEEK